MNLSPEEQFKNHVDAIVRKLMSDNVPRLNENDLSNMLSKVEEIDNIAYKNSTAYILGYIASQSGRKPLKKNIVNLVFEKILPWVDDASVTRPDIIRYARFWQNIT